MELKRYWGQVWLTAGVLRWTDRQETIREKIGEEQVLTGAPTWTETPDPVFPCDTTIEALSIGQYQYQTIQRLCFIDIYSLSRQTPENLVC